MSTLAARAPLSSRGFTLMEVLVTLLLISFASMLMFQMLGSYRIAKQRSFALSGMIDRQALFSAWFRDSVNSLYASETMQFEGAAERFSGPSINAAYLTTGVPIRSTWRLGRTPGGWVVYYEEDGVERWELALASTERAWFVFVDEAGKSHREWPPELGVAEPLPAAVALSRVDAQGAMAVPLVAAVHGTLKPIPRLYEMEED